MEQKKKFTENVGPYGEESSEGGDSEATLRREDGTISGQLSGAPPARASRSCDQRPQGSTLIPVTGEFFLSLWIPGS
jgi:hypothetical protein